MGKPTSTRTEKRFGLDFWMRQVLAQRELALHGLEANPVHDLRVAVQRCRSMADSFRVLDPDRHWKTLRRASKDLSSSIGQLRDSQVMEEWVWRLAPQDDPAVPGLLAFLSAEQQRFKGDALAALERFDCEQWEEWIQFLPQRVKRLPLGGKAFQQLALERWNDAYTLHQRALRNRSKTSWHQLRIGIKRLRHTVENFLPQLSAGWAGDLKRLQDILGEVHDLDVLWATALRIHAFQLDEIRERWQQRVEQERNQRLEQYRKETVGKNSLWLRWRSQLPRGRDVESAGLARLRAWAAFLDPDFPHSSHVARLALQLYDGLSAVSPIRKPQRQRARRMLQAAALLHDVGRSRGKKKHHKAGFRLIRKLTPPLGWTQAELRTAAMIARYHRGALPDLGHTQNGAGRSVSHSSLYLAGILRLAAALDAKHDRSLHVRGIEHTRGFTTISVECPQVSPRMEERFAAARYLLEAAGGHPVLVRIRLNAVQPEVAS